MERRSFARIEKTVIQMEQATEECERTKKHDWEFERNDLSSCMYLPTQVILHVLQ